MTGDVGDHEADEVVAAGGNHAAEGGAKFVLARVELVEAEFLNLCDGEVPAGFAIFLAVNVDGFVGRIGVEDGTGGEEIFGEAGHVIGRVIGDDSLEGTYTMQVWYNDRLLVEKSFTLEPR